MKKNIKTFVMIAKIFSLPQDITIYITDIYCNNNYKNIKDCVIDNFYYPIEKKIIKNNNFEFNDLVLACYQGNIKIVDYLLKNIKNCYDPYNTYFDKYLKLYITSNAYLISSCIKAGNLDLLIYLCNSGYLDIIESHFYLATVYNKPHILSWLINNHNNKFINKEECIYLSYHLEYNNIYELLKK
jgi:hypothetical protein